MTRADYELLEPERVALLRLARRAIEAWLAGRQLIADEPASAVLSEHRGAFVTLHRGGQLRGCIGQTEARASMWRTVRDMAIAAAVRDPRFPALGLDELADTEIEISILDPPERVRGPEDVMIGEHGLTIEYAGRRGLLLPQVAAERGWDAPTFLAMVCRKAGLPDDAWRDPGAVVERFTAQVFGESD